jgi:membrane fusion protein, multidrug efflux system
METLRSARERLRAAIRLRRMYFKRVHGRPTLVVVLLVALVVGIAVATIRSGVSVGAITGTERTDDAYVRADLITISSHIAGYVQSVPVRDNETVRQGQVVATIEDDDYRAKVAAAEAALEAARSSVDALSDRAILQEHVIAAASTEVRAADAVLEQARLEYIRQRGLVADGTTSRRKLEAAEANERRLSAARDQKAAELAAAGEALQVIRTNGVEAEQAVKGKEAVLELARIELGYTRIVSPVAGQLSERGSLPGEYVTPGTKIGMIVPLPHVWVVANFRESQIAHMRPGQSAQITVDSVPGTRFRGTVDSLEPASGALQALLPPDNATGNFTKVAQRFAVKVTLTPGQARMNRLRPGMSAIVTVALGESPQVRSSAR